MALIIYHFLIENRKMRIKSMDTIKNLIECKLFHNNYLMTGYYFATSHENGNKINFEILIIDYQVYINTLC